MKQLILIAIPLLLLIPWANETKAITFSSHGVTLSESIVSEITNTGNDTLSLVQVTVHLYDASNRLIDDSTCWYTTPTNIDAGHTSTFDSFVSSDHINGTPVSYRLSYDWS
jgi:hypothetical protein